MYGAVSALLAAAKATPWVPSSGVSAKNEEVPANFNEELSATAYGPILSSQNVAPTITASGVSGKTLTLSWTAGQPSTATDALDVFVVQFFNDSWTRLLSEQTQVVTSGTKGGSDLYTVTRAIPSDWSGKVNVVVVGWNATNANDIFNPLRSQRAGSDPLTGPYISGPVSLNVG